MASLDELRTNFNFIGVNPSDNVFKKCLELCSKYNITAEDLVDQWTAFTASKLNGSPPTVDALEVMERKELMKQGQEITLEKTLDTKQPENKQSEKTQEEETSKAAKRSRSPEDTQESKRFQLSQQDISSLLSSFSENYNYAEREDPLKIILTFGSQNILFKNEDKCEVSVRQWGPQSNYMSSETRYMYEVMGAMAGSINGIVQHLGCSLTKKYKLNDPEGILKNSGSITTFGRICCDADAKLNSASVQLESTWELAYGHRINLNISKLSSYTLFPGQVVAVEGTLINANTLVAQKIYSDATLPIPMDPVDFQGTMDIIVAAGPFTLSNNLLFEPLQDLLKYAIQKKPQVLIITGPFLDESHEKVNDETFVESFDSFFDNLIECIMASFKNSHTQVVIVASYKDVFHHPVYPTPPYITKHKYTNLHFVPDPSMLSIGGLVVGITTADILFHLSKEEMNSGSNQSDRMSRLISHLLEQQSFYPLSPPNADIPLNVPLLERHGTLEVTPHLLILPSSLRYLVKEVKGSLVVNPERLTKGYIAGTFAHLEVGSPIMGPISNKTKCNIIRI